MIIRNVFYILIFLLIYGKSTGQHWDIQIIKDKRSIDFSTPLTQAKHYIQNGQYDSTIHILQRLVRFNNSIFFQKDQLSLIYNYIGSAYLFKGELKQSIDYFLLAEAFIKEVDTLQMELIKIYNNLSVAFNRIPDNEEALNYLHRAEMLAEKYGYTEALGAVFMNKGRILKEMHLWEESKLQFEKALALAEDTSKNIPTNLAALDVKHLTLTNLGLLYHHQGDFNKAYQLLLAANKMHTETTNPYYRIPNLIGLGNVYLAHSKYQLAEKFLLLALRLSEDFGVTDGIWEAAHNLAHLYATTGDYQKAFEHHVNFSKIEKKIRGKEKVHDIRKLEMKYRIAEKDKKLAESILLTAQQHQLLKNRNQWIAFISLFTLLTLVLLMVIFRNHQQKQQLQQEQLVSLKKDTQVATLNAMIEGEEKERKRIAQNLHDGIGSIISAAKMNLSSISLSEISGKSGYYNGLKLLDEATIEIRNTAHALLPDLLINEGLKSAVTQYCEKINNNDTLEIEYEFNGDVDLLDKPVSLLIYRIIQELINNIIKHAQANKAFVQLSYTNRLLMLAVEDNGRGFDTNSISSTNSGIGLANIKKRIMDMHGAISIESSPNNGTQINIEIEC